MSAPSPRAERVSGHGRCKRPFDLAVLALAFVALLPLWIALALVVPAAIRLDTPGPALYRQRRVGYHLPPGLKLRYDELYMRRMGPALDLRLFLAGAPGDRLPARGRPRPLGEHDPVRGTQGAGGLRRAAAQGGGLVPLAAPPRAGLPGAAFGHGAAGCAESGVAGSPARSARGPGGARLPDGGTGGGAEGRARQRRGRVDACIDRDDRTFRITIPAPVNPDIAMGKATPSAPAAARASRPMRERRR